ncbi:MAG: beta strand repeat-containing protein [Vicinamibacterales bacterium]
MVTTRLVVALLTGGLLAGPPAAAQPTLLASQTLSTAGADCATPTNCAALPEVSLSGVPSLGVYVDVGTSGTFNFEATLDGSTWFAVVDDVNAASSVTADAARFFSNPGYRAFRVRASAINGAATVTFVRGTAGLRSTASLSGGGGDGAIQDGTSSSIEATVFDLTNSNPLSTQIVDANGDAITSFGGGTQYAVDAALGATPTGTLAVGIRDDALSALTPVEGDAIGLRVDANGALWTIPSGTTTVSGTVTANLSATDNAVLDDIADGIAVTNAGTFATQAAQSGTWTVQPGNTANTTPWLTSISQGGNTAAVNASGQLSITCANCSGSGASSVDDAAFTVASDSGAVAMALFDDTTPDSVDEGDAGGLRMSANRNLYSTLRDAAGNERGANVDASNRLTVVADLGATDNAVLDSIADGIDVTNAGTFAVQVTSAPTTTVTATNLDVQSGGADLATSTQAGAIQTAVETLDNTVGVEDAAETAGGGLAMAGSVRRDTAATSAGTTGDNATINTDALGRLWIRNGGVCADEARVTSVAINTATSGNVELVALASGETIYVCGYSLVASGDVDVQFIYGTGTACGTGETDLTGPWDLTTNSGITQANGGSIQFKAAASNALCVELSAAVQVSGHVTYVRTANP